MTRCIEWQGARNSDGYGSRRFRGRTVRAHRVAWELTYGPIPADMCVLHKCDNPPCVNPKHLFLGTQGDNIRDMFAKGRNNPKTWLGSRNAEKTHCSRGHAFTPENTKIRQRPDGSFKQRVCRTCDGAAIDHLRSSHD